MVGKLWCKVKPFDMLRGLLAFVCASCFLLQGRIS